MGNRGLVIFKDQDIGVYLHWNGGRDSVYPFLEYCRMKGYRTDDYAPARFCQVVGNFFGGTLHLGVWCVKGDSLESLNQGDGGIYIVENWDIVGRYPENIQEQNSYDPVDFLIGLDEKQPETERLGEAFIREYMKKKAEKEGGEEVDGNGKDPD